MSQQNSGLIYEDLDGVTPTGIFTAIGTPDGMRAVVIKKNNDGLSSTVKRFEGETAWSDAVREAGDLNAKASR